MKNKNSLIWISISIIVLIIVFLINIIFVKEELEYYVEISVSDYGKIIVELDSSNAPITVSNFVSLVEDKFYDGLTFHRIIENFMIQGGRSTKSVKTIKGEFLQNGVKNNISHKRGVISMARSDNYNSASSEFFIVQKDSFHLDGLYAAFGKVLEGMDVVDKIALVKVEDDNGTVLSENQPVIEYIKLIDYKKNGDKNENNS